MQPYSTIENSLALLAQYGYPTLWLSPDEEIALAQWASVPLAQFAAVLTPAHLQKCLQKSLPVQNPPYSYKSCSPKEWVSRTIHYSLESTIWGNVLIASHEKRICFCHFTEDLAEGLTALETQFPTCQFLPTTSSLHQQVAESFLKGSIPEVELLLIGSNFQISVWQALLEIPIGHLLSYTSLAEKVGKPAQAARAVGTAIGQNPIAYLVPCHRVIRTSGILGDFRWGRTRKYAMIGCELTQFA